MSLLALCYPQLGAADQRFIDGFGNDYDQLYRDAVGPHFTMVFQVRDLAETIFTDDVARVAEKSAPFGFVCRYAMVRNDVSSVNSYVFLVPDGGSASSRCYTTRSTRTCWLRSFGLMFPTSPTLVSLRSRPSSLDYKR